jgi:hypothetical protein
MNAICFFSATAISIDYSIKTGPNDKHSQKKRAWATHKSEKSAAWSTRVYV